MEDLFKATFVHKYAKILKDEIDNFLEASSSSLLPSIRVNTLKITGHELEERLKEQGYRLKEIPWYENGYVVIKPRVGLGKTLEHALGYFYLQDAASMIPPLILNPCEHEKILDLCAAPGSKTTQMAQMMRNTGVIVANDPRKHRLKALFGNLQRCGVCNTIVTKMDGRDFSRMVGQEFDKVLVDAPCSGSGAIRRRNKIATEWSSEVVKGLSELQKDLILSGFECLRDGGILVYSTCSLDPEENEEVVNHLLKERSDCELETIELENVQGRKGLIEWEKNKYHEALEMCVRIYPQDNDTIGFFLCKVRKIES